MKAKILRFSLASIFIDFTGLGSDIELEIDDVSVEHLIVATLLQVETFGAHLSFRPAPVQILKLHNLGADEASFEVGMDHARGSRCLRALANGPALDLVLTSREVVNQLKRAVANIH